MTTVRFDAVDGVATITLDRPASLNSLTTEVMVDLGAALRRHLDRRPVRHVRCTFGPRLGIVPDLGTTWHLPRRAGRARALGLTMLGGRISAEQAASWGLIWSVVDDDRLDEEVRSVAAQLAGVRS